MNIQYNIIANGNIQDSHRETFGKMLETQGKVQGDLFEKADRCKMICIASINGRPIAIGGIKLKTTSDFNKEKADLPDLSKEFEWELGYLFTIEKHCRKGVASNMVSLLLSEFGNNNLMASTEITSNPAMVKILERNGFRHYGKPWKSGIHENYLGLFLKFQ